MPYILSGAFHRFPVFHKPSGTVGLQAICIYTNFLRSDIQKCVLTSLNFPVFQGNPIGIVYIENFQSVISKIPQILGYTQCFFLYMENTRIPCPFFRFCTCFLHRNCIVSFLGVFLRFSCVSLDFIVKLRHFLS